MSSLIRSLRGHRWHALSTISILLGATFLLCYSVLATDWIGTPVLCGIAIILATAQLIRTTERSNESFAQFINNISHDDFSSTTAHSDNELSTRQFVQAQKVLLEKYRKLKADRSAQHEYLHLVVEHVETALLCFDENGSVAIINKAAKDLLKSRYITNLSRIDSINEPLANALRLLKAGDNRVMKVSIGSSTYQLILSATEFRLLDREHKLVSMQNIQSALDEKEIESWQKLIKVLTHEIMNSMTPIVSLSTHLESVVLDGRQSEAGVVTDAEQYSDIVNGIESIAARSQGLLRFVQTYRSLSSLPRPVPVEIDLQILFQRLATLLRERFHERGIDFRYSIKPMRLIITADINQIEQILLNLLSNAVDAVTGRINPRVELIACLQEHDAVALQVRDNGCGIARSYIDDIFTPFFSTKETGTGVGLSLSRQLARLNNATLTVHSTENRGSSFELLF